MPSQLFSGSGSLNREINGFLLLRSLTGGFTMHTQYNKWAQRQTGNAHALLSNNQPWSNSSHLWPPSLVHLDTDLGMLGNLKCWVISISGLKIDTEVCQSDINPDNIFRFNYWVAKKISNFNHYSSNKLLWKVKLL